MVVHLKGWVVLVLAGMVSGGCESNGGASAPQEPTPQEAANTEITSAGSTADPGVWDLGPQEPLSEVDINAIKDAVKKGAESYRDGKFDGFKDKFTDDGKLMPPNSSPRNGKQAIKAFARLSPKVDSLTVTNIQVDGAGKKATVTASFEMTGKTHDPANNNELTIPVSSTGTLLIAMKKKSGAWLAKDVAYVAQ